MRYHPYHRVPDPVSVPPRRAQLLRLFRLSGLFPLPAFLALHAAVNARALAGDTAFLSAAHELQRIPLLPVAEVLFVLGPLLVHTAVGVWIVAARVPMTDAAPLPPAIRVATRVSALLVLAFLALHFGDLRFHAGLAQPSPATLLATLDARLSGMRYGVPLRAVAYLLASAAACFHLGVGFWGAFARSPRGAAAQSRRRAAWWSAAVGGILWLLFADVVIFHATGARLFGAEASDTGSTLGPCPPTTASTPPPKPPMPPPSSSAP